jgi:thymidylate synthase (FAD)
LAKEREFIITDTPPKVFLVGISQPVETGLNDYLKYRGKQWNRNEFVYPESLIAFGGAVCYDSLNNPSGKSDREYIGTSIIEHAHGSVLEHVHVNLAVASLPRSTQLELVRHRAGMAYSFRSTRFADNWIEFCVPPAMREHGQARTLFESHARFTFDMYGELAEQIMNDPFLDISPTLQRKRIKEAARDILGGCVGSDGLVTMNARALRHIIQLRTADDAAVSIREFAYEVYRATELWLPSIFQDATEVAPTGEGPPVVQFAHPKI